MPRTITGSYIVRPTSYREYLTSGTFGDYFSTAVSTTSSGWNGNLNVGTAIGDNSDSTYYSDTSVSTSSTTAKNALMNLTVSSGTVPSFDYTVTKVTLGFRTRASSTTNNTRILRLWNTLWYSGGYSASPKSMISQGNFGYMNAQGSTSSTTLATSAVSTYSVSETSFTNSTIPAAKYPDRMAICALAYKTSHLVSYNAWYLYDVWWIIDWTYTENEETVSFFRDDGVTVSAGGNDVPTGQYTDYRHTTYTLTATVQNGYVFDGWYLNGTKVSSDLTYTYELYQGDELYCITKVRKVFNGTVQFDKCYIGDEEISAIYIGTEKVWGLSDLYGDATAVG